MNSRRIFIALRVFLLVTLFFAASCDSEQTADVSAVQSQTAGDEISQVVKKSTINPASSDNYPDAMFSTAGRIDTHPQRAGDPAAGRQALLEEAYVGCGIPEMAFRELLQDVEVVEASGRSSASDGLPYSSNLVRDKQGVSIVTSNCLSCHATTLFGELVIGLGNEFLDFTKNQSVLVERAGLLVNGIQQIEAWETYADRINAIAPYIQTHTIGVNPANNLTFALIAHRDAKTNAWSESPLLPLPPVDPAPVSVPPWWRMEKKPAMFNMGEGRADHATIMMAASMLCSDSIEELQNIDTYAPHIRAFIASLEAPRYPFKIDVAKAIKGKTVFEQNCSRCHGTYADSEVIGQTSSDTSVQDTYPARLIPIDVVGTDDTLVQFAHSQGAAYSDWFNRSYYGRQAVAAPGPGYIAPPLDGIWATGPFLHNGSVPTIMQLLDSSTRARYWRHTIADTDNPEAFDQQNLGWQHRVLAHGKSASNSLRNENPADEAVYDTDLPGYANTGHLFGDHLTDEQRSLVIEYIKTL